MVTSIVPWSRVQHAARRVAIVGSGPSLKGFDLSLLRDFDVIAVNSAILHLPFAPRFWFSMDPALPNRAIMARAKDCPDTVFYFAAFPDHGLKMDAAHRDRRDATIDERVIYLRRIEGIHRVGARPALSTDPTGVHCGNSAYGALGLGFHMKPERIALFGVDARTDQGYAWGPGQPTQDLRFLQWLFASAQPQLDAAGIKVLNGSPESRVTCFPRVTPDDAAAWLAESLTENKVAV